MKINRENMIDCMCLSVYHSPNATMRGSGRGGGTNLPAKFKISLNYVIKLPKICHGPPPRQTQLIVPPPLKKILHLLIVNSFINKNIKCPIVTFFFILEIF